MAHDSVCIDAGSFLMSHNATLCKEALGKKLPAQVAQRTCFCFVLRSSFLPDGLLYYNRKRYLISHWVKCLLCVGTKTVTAIFSGAWAGNDS